MKHVEVIDDLYKEFPSMFSWDKKFLAKRKLLDGDAFYGLCLVGLSGFLKSLSEVSYAVDKKTLSLHLYREMLCYCANELIDEYSDIPDSLCPEGYGRAMEKGIDLVMESNKEEVKEVDGNYVLSKLLNASENHKSLIDFVNDSFVPKLVGEGKKDKSGIISSLPPIIVPKEDAKREEEEKDGGVILPEQPQYLLGCRVGSVTKYYGKLKEDAKGDEKGWKVVRDGVGCGIILCDKLKED